MSDQQVYNLTDNVNESFQFKIGDDVYQMRYPTVEEIEKLQKISEKYADSDDSGEDEIMEFMYSFISSVNESSPAIGDVLKKQNVKVLQNFNTMFKTEFGIE